MGWGWELLGNTFTWDGVGNCLGTPLLGVGLGIAWEHLCFGWDWELLRNICSPHPTKGFSPWITTQNGHSPIHVVHLYFRWGWGLIGNTFTSDNFTKRSSPVIPTPPSQVKVHSHPIQHRKGYYSHLMSVYLRRRRPLSAQLMVTCRISSSKKKWRINTVQYVAKLSTILKASGHACSTSG